MMVITIGWQVHDKEQVTTARRDAAIRPDDGTAPIYTGTLARLASDD